MSVQATLLRVVATYAALRADVDAAELEAADRTDAIEVIAAVSVLAVLADVDALAVACAPAAMDLDVKAVVLDAMVELGEYLVYREFFDAFSSRDEAVTAIEKRVTDPVFVADAAVVSPRPGVDESLSASEQLAMLTAKRLADVVAAIDAASVMSFSMLDGAALSDGPHPTDVASIGAQKPVGDAASASDAAAVATLKALAEAVAASDAAILTWLAIREEQDGVLAVDAAALSATLAPTDATSAADGVLLLAVSKAIADAAAAADLASLALARAAADAAATADAHALTHSKRRADAVACREAGMVSLSEYAIDYFDEDYVLSDMSAF